MTYNKDKKKTTNKGDCITAQACLWQKSSKNLVLNAIKSQRRHNDQTMTISLQALDRVLGRLVNTAVILKTAMADSMYT